MMDCERNTQLLHSQLMVNPCVSALSKHSIPAKSLAVAMDFLDVFSLVVVFYILLGFVC